MADEEEIEPDGTDEIVPDDVEPDDLADVEGDIDPDDLLEDEDDLESDPDVLVVDPLITDEGSTLAPTDVAKPKSAEDEDDEDDLRTEDDVEADLSSILQEKLSSPQETAPDEEEEAISDDRTDGVERLQPRRPDETQCTHCFLLVRQNAPGCPVEDDACPLFKTA
jgi:segregation and condensation protein B